MARPAGTGPRLRITVPDATARGSGYDGPPKIWWQPSGKPGTIAQLLEQLAVDLGLGLPARQLALEMSGFVLLSSSAASLLRDGDALVLVPTRKRKTGALAVLRAPPAAKKVKATAGGRAVAATAAAPVAAGIDGGSNKEATNSSSEEKSSNEEEGSGSSSSSSSSEEESSSSKEKESSSSSSVDDEGAHGMSSSEEEESSSEEDEDEHFFTPGNKLVAAPTDASPVGNGSGHGAAAAAAPASVRPSRSARRKAAKRRLRRLGVLPPKSAAKVAAAAAPARRQPPAGQPAQPALAPTATPTPNPAALAVARDAALVAAAAADPLNPHVTPAAVPAAATAAGQPEVTVSAQWQANMACDWDGPPDGKQQRQLQGAQATAAAEHQQRQGLAATVAQPTEPMSDAEFAALPLVAGVPPPGVVVAYKLLEMGPDLAPQVSEVRLGRVLPEAAGGGALALAPHPAQGPHPLAYRRWLSAKAAAADGDEYDEEDEPPNEYEEDGTLTAELASFVEIRLLEGDGRPKRQLAQQALELKEPAKPSIAAPAAATRQEQQQSQQHDQAEQQEELGPSSWARQGPPRPAASTPIAPEGGWASLYAQLQARRAELSGSKGQAADVRSHPLASPLDGTPEQQRQANGTAVAGGTSGPGRGASRPRGGVRQTALGPMLAALRQGGVFGGSGGESG